MPQPKKGDQHLGVAIFTRVPPVIHKAFKQEADANRRPMSSQLLVILEARYIGGGELTITRVAQALVDVFGECTEEQAKAVWAKLRT
jgi:hypothetical protein